MKYETVLMASILVWLSVMPIPPESQASTSESPKAQPLYRMPDTPQAPDFNLVDLDGKSHRMSDYLGKVVIINFWATWCPPCREEMPSMQRAWRKLDDEGIVMLAINVGEDEDTIFTFTANYPVEFPLLLDSDSAVIQAWPVRGLPTTFVVNPQGKIVYRAIGSRAWDDPDILGVLRALQSP